MLSVATSQIDQNLNINSVLSKQRVNLVHVIIKNEVERLLEYDVIVYVCYSSGMHNDL